MSKYKDGAPMFVTANKIPHQSEMEATLQLLKSRHSMIHWDAKTRTWRCEICKKKSRDARKLAEMPCRK